MSIETVLRLMEKEANEVHLLGLISPNDTKRLLDLEWRRMVGRVEQLNTSLEQHRAYRADPL